MESRPRKAGNEDWTARTHIEDDGDEIRGYGILFDLAK